MSTGMAPVLVDRFLHLSRVYRNAAPVPLRHAINLFLIGILLTLGTVLVYYTGGTAFAYPYLMLIPVAVAAALYRLPGGIAAAVVAGLLLGPYMPLDVSTGETQSTENWLIRSGLYVVLGGLFGIVFSGLHYFNLRNQHALRVDARSSLPNAAALDDDLACAMDHLALSGKTQLLRQAPLSALQLTFVRITDLSDILETFGPDAADQALAEMSQRVRQRIGDAVAIYRFSVSEFVVLDRQNDIEDPRAKLRRVEAAFGEMIEVRGIPVKLEAAIGTCQVTSGDIKPGTLIQRARLALSSAIEKNSGYSVYDADEEVRMNNLIRVITGVRKGLGNGEFDLHFQPKICLRRGTVVGSEGLIRWYAPNGETISPAHFMPKVEATSLIDPVTRFVVNRACRHLQREVDSHVSINFSARNLLDDDLIKALPGILASYGVSPTRLEIELTESALIGQPGRAREIIQELRHQGFDVSLDDFGTGYSSFEYLTQLPVSGLKIDRAFVRRLSEGVSNQSVMRSMIDLGKALELTVTLEGIEHPGERDLLTEMGGDIGQGFYFQRPLPESDYIQWRQLPVFAS